MNQQEKYWELLKQLKFELFYVDEYIANTNKKDSMINFTTSIASSGSIAGWAIWNKIGIIWSIIIAISQVIHAVKPVLPYSKRLKLLQQMYTEISSLSIEVEYIWFQVSNGDLTEKQIHEKIFEIKRKRNDITNRHLSSHVLPLKDELKIVADKSVTEYLMKNYIGE